MRKIWVIIKNPGQKPYSTWISDTLHNLQGHVGGYIETVTISSKRIVVICNEEGRIIGLPFNCVFEGVNYVGALLFAGYNESEFADLPMTYAEFKRTYPALFLKADAKNLGEKEEEP